jgi:hypothetical protein
MLGQEDASEMLTLVNAILSESSEAAELCDPIINEVLDDLNQEDEYQRSIAGDTRDEEEPTNLTQKKTLSQEEVNDAIMDAYEKGDMEEVARLRREYLGESKILDYRLWVALNS